VFNCTVPLVTSCTHQSRAIDWFNMRFVLLFVVLCLKVVTEVRCSKSGITALAYSQDGTLLAAACADGDVHILRVENKVSNLLHTID
jgi:Anaphase-promoting complex subunit 4 WD40 domain